MIDRAAALRRLRACMRLSRSANEHEAAAAMRNAQKLMAEYDLTEADADEAPFSKSSAETRYGQEGFPTYIAMLADLVARLFGCKPIGGYRHRPGGGLRLNMQFFGPTGKPEICAYAFTVLRRQLDAQTSRYTRRIRKRSNKVRRGAAFAIGWVAGLSDKLDLAPLSIEQEESIDRFVEQCVGATAKQACRYLTDDKSLNRDGYNGMAAGREAELHSGLANATTPRRLEALP